MSEKINLPYWEDDGININYSQSFYLPDKTKTIIIGAGIQGLLLGLYLGIMKHPCYIFDGTSPGMRSSIRGDGIIGLGPCSLPSKKLINTDVGDILRLINLSVENQRIFRTLLGACDTNIDWCEYKNFGGLHVNSSSTDLKEIDKSLLLYQKVGLPVAKINKQNYDAMCGISYGNEGIFIPNEATINPKLLISGLIKANEILGNKVLIGMFLGNIFPIDDKTTMVSDDIGNSIIADNVVICLNAMAQKINIPKLQSIMTTYRIQYLASSETKNTEKITKYPINISDKFLLRQHNNRFLCGINTQEFDTIDKISIADAKVDIATMVYNYAFLKNAVHLNDENEISHVWSRNISKSKDGLPLVGKIPGYNNVYLSSGHDLVNGLSYVGIGAKIIGELIMKNKTTVAGAELLSPERFKKELNSDEPTV